MKKLDKEQIKSIYMYVLKRNHKVKVVYENVRIIDEDGYEWRWTGKWWV